MAMSENRQSRNATESKEKFDKFHERIDAYRDKLNDPGTPEWEKNEMTNNMEQMSQQLDKAVKRQSSSEPPPETQPPAPERPGVSTASSGGVSQSGPTPGTPGGPTPSHVVTPVGGQKPEDKK